MQHFVEHRFVAASQEEISFIFTSCSSLPWVFHGRGRPIGRNGATVDKARLGATMAVSFKKGRVPACIDPTVAVMKSRGRSRVIRRIDVKHKSCLTKPFLR